MRQVISKDDKAVSPIIATILLIAITVVLAATLVTILGGFTKGASGSAATASATTQFSNTTATGGNNVYINVSAFSVTGISSGKISFTVTITGAGAGTITGTLAALSSTSTSAGYTLTGPSQFTGGSHYVIGGITGTINTVTVQLTYSGTVVYTS
jgi:flagellin-like protein